MRDDDLYSLRSEQRFDGTAVLTCIDNPQPVMELPSHIENRPITAIGSDIVPLGVKSVPREIILPASVTSIGHGAFQDLRYLKKLVLPEGLLQIGDFAIYTCPDLQELYIPPSVERLGRYAVGYMYEHARAYRLNYFTLLCKQNSAAHHFAEENQLTYRLV